MESDHFNSRSATLFLLIVNYSVLKSGLDEIVISDKIILVQLITGQIKKKALREGFEPPWRSAPPALKAGAVPGLATSAFM